MGGGVVFFETIHVFNFSLVNYHITEEGGLREVGEGR